MASVIIVESKNDKAFYQALINHLNLKNTEVDGPVCISGDDFHCMEGIDSNIENPSKLITHLKSIKTEIVKKDISKIGIVLDLDTSSVDERLEMVNNAVSNVFLNDKAYPKVIKKPISFEKYHIQDREISIACYFTNAEGKGELETVLKKIAKEEAPFADCLTSWKKCLTKKNWDINEKEFEKFWVNNYIRFDTCSKTEKSRRIENVA